MFTTSTGEAPMMVVWLSEYNTKAEIPEYTVVKD